ncbi:hypothetical protein M0R45_028701 [Rubus argutus]|uniref:non-specific serine/threonine protein kinase n=1 Tax=Rubus argutus TaxID=59490 RepID=A0AAW1W820_RUBAR
MATMRLLLFLALCSTGIHVILSDDAAALQSLKVAWQNYPPSWDRSSDYCGWEGVTCKDSSVTAFGDIGAFTELTSLDLSFNPGLTGSLSPGLGNLKKLNILILAGCRFTGNIPDELGNLGELTFLALNTNNLTGGIPASLVSSVTSPAGLDQLLNAKHFHFNKNQLSGQIPANLFSAEMVLIHVLFDGNKFSGPIPSTIGLVQTLEALRLDRNALTGTVPSSISNLTNVIELNLAFNKLTGPLPDLTGMNSLNYVDLSNNSFDPSVAPRWLSALPYSPLCTVPETLFSLQDIQQVKLKNNDFNGTLNLGDSISEQLDLLIYRTIRFPSHFGLSIQKFINTCREPCLQQNHCSLYFPGSAWEIGKHWCCYWDSNWLFLSGFGLSGSRNICHSAKKRAERAIGLSRPFASWHPAEKIVGVAPQLKGSGGYGKVYRGMFADGLVVAIKRAQQDQCRVVLSSRLKLSCSREFITKILSVLSDFVLNKENRCWFTNICLMEHLGKACQGDLAFIWIGREDSASLLARQED